MAAVTLDLTQSGSDTTEIHAESGDTVTLELSSTVENDILADAVAGAQALFNVAGVTIAASTAGSAGSALYLTQSGSATTSIHAAAGDTITLELAATVENDVLASAVASFQALLAPTGVAFAIDTSGGAS